MIRYSIDHVKEGMVLDRPKVVIFETKYGRRMNPFMIDLKESEDIKIEAVL